MRRLLAYEFSTFVFKQQKVQDLIKEQASLSRIPTFRPKIHSVTFKLQNPNLETVLTGSLN
jgi:hypothetical protein